jgi:nitrogen regulatory protein P-II 1
VSSIKEWNMELKCVVAIVHRGLLEPFEKRLALVHIHGMTVTKVRGFGAHPNTFADDWTTDRMKIEVFTQAENVDAVIKAITEDADGTAAGRCVVAVLPVESFARYPATSDPLFRTGESDCY